MAVCRMRGAVLEPIHELPRRSNLALVFFSGSGIDATTCVM